MATSSSARRAFTGRPMRFEGDLAEQRQLLLQAEKQLGARAGAGGPRRKRRGR